MCGPRWHVYELGKGNLKAGRPPDDCMSLPFAIWSELR